FYAPCAVMPHGAGVPGCRGASLNQFLNLFRSLWKYWLWLDPEIDRGALQMLAARWFISEMTDEYEAMW
ncbi:MAG: hypothetical protein RJB13_2198, partial [Pseudomonadota bacterium]